MLTNEERIKAIHKRAAEIEITKRRTQQTLIRVGTVAACLAGIVLLAIYIPGITDRFAEELATTGMQAFSELGKKFEPEGRHAYAYNQRIETNHVAHSQNKR